MAEPFVKPSAAGGEVAPAFYGRIDVDKWHAGLSVARNCFISYLGGALSRAGTALVGVSKQLCGPASTPPRLIAFLFNIFQAYILEFGDKYMRVIANGGYVTESAFSISAISLANPCVLTIPGNNYAANDDIFLGSIGIAQLTNRTVRARAVVGNAVTIEDEFGTPINSLNFAAYAGGGTAARLYTLATPYAAADLPYLKFVQSADVMSLCLVNQQTQTDYAPQELTRVAANNWTIAPPTFAASLGPPTSATVTGTTYVSGAGPAAYGYVVTALDAVTGQESIASNIAVVTGVVDIAGQFGTNKVSWTAPTALSAPNGVDGYNIYRATPDYTNTGTFTGQLFGYVGTTSGATTWQDTNVIADFTKSPPLHNNPFASSGNYPGLVGYFQQRRGYKSTLNAPDTAFYSKTGAFTNFDAGDPPIDSDAITVTPWSQQVNALQFSTPMPGGEIVWTGLDTWQISGTGGPGTAITPSQVNAQQQESNGCSAILPPLKVDYDVLFGQSLGSAIRDYQYNFYFNIYAGTDTTVLSNHLFFNHQMLQWTWAREPYKVVWIVRDDGRALSLSWIKDQDVKAYARHDTNGLFVSVASASEPPVNAVYWAVKRFIRGAGPTGQGQWAYMIERMDNRLWGGNVENVWAVDCGLALAQPQPAATLTVSAAQGTGGVLPGPIVTGGANYSNAVQGLVTDLAGTGSGAVVNSITVLGGAITAYTISPEGAGYGSPMVTFQDATGSGAITGAILDTFVTLATDAPAFSSPADVGSVVRAGGGVMVITAVATAQSATANVVQAVTAMIPNDPNNTPLPFASGTWTKTAPVSSVAVPHLAGMLVTGLADGNVIPPTVAAADGTVALPQPASSVVIGLPFTPQAQTLHASLPGQEVQGKHKKIVAVTLRVTNSRGLQVGQDQPVAAQQPNQAEIPWGVAPYGALSAANDRQYGLSGATAAANQINAGRALPLFSGDIRVPLATSDWNTPDGQRSPGMVGVQQNYPLPMEISAVIPEIVVGDTNG